MDALNSLLSMFNTFEPSEESFNKISELFPVIIEDEENFKDLIYKIGENKSPSEKQEKFKAHFMDKLLESYPEKIVLISLSFTCLVNTSDTITHILHKHHDKVNFKDPDGIYLNYLLSNSKLNIALCKEIFSYFPIKLPIPVSSVIINNYDFMRQDKEDEICLLILKNYSDNLTPYNNALDNLAYSASQFATFNYILEKYFQKLDFTILHNIARNDNAPAEILKKVLNKYIQVKEIESKGKICAASDAGLSALIVTIARNKNATVSVFKEILNQFPETLTSEILEIIVINGSAAIFEQILEQHQDKIDLKVLQGMLRLQHGYGINESIIGKIFNFIAINFPNQYDTEYDLFLKNVRLSNDLAIKKIAKSAFSVTGLYNSNGFEQLIKSGVFKDCVVPYLAAPVLFNINRESRIIKIQQEYSVEMFEQQQEDYSKRTNTYKMLH